jgi:hypothetical protein
MFLDFPQLLVSIDVPILRCQGLVQLQAVQNLSVKLSAADLELRQVGNEDPDHLGQLQARESFTLTWRITDYIPGEHNIRVSATWADTDGPLRSYNKWHRIILPAPLMASKAFFKLPTM